MLIMTDLDGKIHYINDLELYKNMVIINMSLYQKCHYLNMRYIK